MSAPSISIHIPSGKLRGRFHDDTFPVAARNSPRSIAVFSGGSAMNSFVTLLQTFTDDTAYIMPVSDDGGSTSEIIKVLGGPGIGDLRSRVVRLAETGSSEAKAVHDLLSYRLPFDNQERCAGSPSMPKMSAKAEWLEILEGRHHLWHGISHPYRETIRRFLAYFQHELFKLATRKPPFDFQGGSIGNFFLTGSRLFFDNLDAAIFQFARIMRVPPRTEVIPIVATTRGAVTIAAVQRNGSVIVGQCEISHPGQPVPEGMRPRGNSVGATDKRPPTPTSELTRQMSELTPFQSLSRSVSQNLIFSKDGCPPLCSPIRRIYYVNRERQEIFAELNPLVESALGQKKTIIYGCGSLYTSILPCLIVPGVGRLLADPVPRAINPRSVMPLPYPLRNHLSRVKLLLLNGTHDRETEGYSAMDFILAITDALNYSCLAEQRRKAAEGRPVWTQTIMEEMECDVLKPEERDLAGRSPGLGWLAGSTGNGGDLGPSGPTAGLVQTLESDTGKTYLASPNLPGAYITHMLYPDDGLVKVNVEKIEAWGIRCVRVKASQGEGAGRGLYGVDELKEVMDHLVM